MAVINFRASLRKFDWVLLSLVVVLVAISLATIYSIDLSQGEKLQYFPKQSIAFFIGLVLIFAASFFHISFFRTNAKLFYALAIFLLIAVLFFGQTIRGTRGWFNVAGFSFQPAEFAKVGLIIFLAWWINRYGRRFDKWQFVFTSGFFCLVLVGLIMLQPDMGSALVLGGIWFGYLFLTGVKKRYILLLVVSGLLLFLVSWFFIFQDYQKNRIMNFFDASQDPLGVGYNVTQSIIAIGSGQVMGRGLGFGSQSQLHFLPEAQTDFIFAVVSEELGFIGSSLVLIVFFLLLWRLLYIAKKSQDEFSTYLILGIILLFFIHILINIGAVSGFMPVIGVTLPFLSYGGSSLIINMFLIGIAESVACHS